MEKQKFFEKDGTKYFRLRVNCPTCREKGINTPSSYWTHLNDDCNGGIFIGDNAHFYCEKCGAEEHILKSKLSSPCCDSDVKESRILFVVESDNDSVVLGNAVSLCRYDGYGYWSAMVDKMFRKFREW
ncbi:hypothetical protein [Capnocytophaga canimorsus]|uniref:hypothetical protein n=1 Tax=Capnocytophaga canimorsus TaxID=28188 RepID=UPI001AC5E3EA|nr:hypothetical protein [Capnocytophaga canimorsus]GIM59638.1 hypothetical protein CAPN007_18470 [Capnocytophaga canimorsus]